MPIFITLLKLMIIDIDKGKGNVLTDDFVDKIYKQT